MARLKIDKSVVFLIMADKVFLSRGPATENTPSPNFVLVRETSDSFVVTERSRRWSDIDEIGVVTSDSFFRTGSVAHAMHENIVWIVSDRRSVDSVAPS